VQKIYKNEAVAKYRRVYFKLVDATDLKTAEPGEADGQPYISFNGADYVTTENVLVAISSGTYGSYYVELTPDEVNNEKGCLIRYKSANTAEFEDVVFFEVQDDTIINQIRTKVQNTFSQVIKTSQGINKISQQLNVSGGGSEVEGTFGKITQD
jgi:hypothetical protein